MPQGPEDRAREQIDAKLIAAGWLIQNADAIDLAAGPGIAVRELALAPGFGVADHLLHVRRQAAGIIEARAAGLTLTGVEAKVAAGLRRAARLRRAVLARAFGGAEGAEAAQAGVGA